MKIDHTCGATQPDIQIENQFIKSDEDLWEKYFEEIYYEKKLVKLR